MAAPKRSRYRFTIEFAPLECNLYICIICCFQTNSNKLFKFLRTRLLERLKGL